MNQMETGSLNAHTKTVKKKWLCMTWIFIFFMKIWKYEQFSLLNSWQVFRTRLTQSKKYNFDYLQTILHMSSQTIFFKLPTYIVFALLINSDFIDYFFIFYNCVLEYFVLYYLTQIKKSLIHLLNDIWIEKWWRTIFFLHFFFCFNWKLVVVVVARFFNIYKTYCL